MRLVGCLLAIGAWIVVIVAAAVIALVVVPIWW